MAPLLWLKLKKYAKLENYIAFVENTDLSKVPPLSRGDTSGLKQPDVPGLFAYQPIYDTLRQKYALDTAVRGNTDFERALSVMQWLTDNTWYSGAQYHLLRDDPLQILDYAYRKPFKNAINCRFKAIVLSDLLQAFGIPAYPIAMLDANKNGNHLTVHVYLKRKNSGRFLTRLSIRILPVKTVYFSMPLRCANAFCPASVRSYMAMRSTKHSSAVRCMSRCLSAPV